MDSHDIFISYSRKDSEKVLSVVEKLQERGFSIWIDKDGIESGDAFKSVIVRAIKNSDVFLFFSSFYTVISPQILCFMNLRTSSGLSYLPCRYISLVTAASTVPS